MTMDKQRSLVVTNMTVSYRENRALHDISTDFPAGQITALMGMNGSGKSTLIKSLAGVNSGQTKMKVCATRKTGQATWTRSSVLAAHRGGLRFIHQDTSFQPKLSIFDNMLLASQKVKRFNQIDWRGLKYKFQESLERLNIDARLGELIEDTPLSLQIQIRVAIALQDIAPNDIAYIFVDEPTATLDVNESDRLLRSLKDIAAMGHGLILVTHRLPEVLDYTEDVIVLRDGIVAAEFSSKTASQGMLLDALVGQVGRSIATTPIRHDDQIAPRDMERLPDTHERSSATFSSSKHEILRLDGITGATVRNLSISINAGEVTAFAGFEGSGVEELAEILYGQVKPVHGTVALKGQTLVLNTPQSAVKAGIGLVPKDRRAAGGVVELSAAENIFLPNFAALKKRGFLSSKEMVRDSVAMLKRLKVYPGEPSRKFGSFSGGNQQKLVLGRWLAFERDLLLLVDPTAGVDAAARQSLWQEIRSLARQEIAIILISSDINEVVALSNRVVVMSKGAMKADLSRDEMSEMKITELAMR